MQRSRRSSWMLLRSKKNPAISKFITTSLNGQRLFVVKPETGKTHQIRVALKSVGSAILGDPIYSPSLEAAEMDRCYLHACALRLDLPDKPSLQMALCPAMGEHFTSADFRDAWNSFVLPAITTDSPPRSAEETVELVRRPPAEAEEPPLFRGKAIPKHLARLDSGRLRVFH
uniref:Pseudouridine synthase RsuA/RluA-like domain-containing protein n=1 Tax=Lotharella oceanica TaxID=641309 RepID=A0A7S2X8V4_9EUKA|mmetsp:Transcript_14451/g.27432  ORF Transcript_14451/g.27432 Transcript_14451/m.27432 type:complete len:172 (+) Transcript_14451:2-517(+)